MPPPPPPQQQQQQKQEEETAINGISEAGGEDGEMEEEEDPEEVEPWVPSSDSEPEPDRPAVEPPDPSPAAAEPALQKAVLMRKRKGEEATQRWPGWPGASVFRLVVPADKVGGVIGRRGGTVKRLCDETRARVRVLDAPRGAANQIVLVSATEEVDAELSPAMNAAIKIFKHIIEIEEINSDGTLSSAAPKNCSVRLLVPAIQAFHLIGKQGATIKSIQESTGVTIKIIDRDELLSCETLDERIVEIHGAYLEAHNALKSVLGLLRKFLVDHGVLHLFERKLILNQDVAQTQDTSKENQFIDDYPLAANQDFWLSDQRSYGNPIGSRLLYGHDPSFDDPYSSNISHATDSLMMQMGHANPKGSRFLYGCDQSFHDTYSPDLSQPTDPLITEITQTMKIPLPYAEEIIGLQGENIEYIRSVSGAVVVLEEIGDNLDEEVLSCKSNREPPPSRICHRDADAGPRLPSSPPHHSGSRLPSSPHLARGGGAPHTALQKAGTTCHGSSKIDRPVTTGNIPFSLRSQRLIQAIARQNLNHGSAPDDVVKLT